MTSNQDLQRDLDVTCAIVIGYLNSPDITDIIHVKHQIDNCIKKHGKSYLDANIMFDKINKYGKMLNQTSFIQNIDLLVDYILEQNVVIDVEGYKLGYHIGHYKLLEKAFQNNIIPGNADYHYAIDIIDPLISVIYSKKTNEQIIIIIDLFCRYGYNINTLNPSFVLLYKLPVIQYLIGKISKPLNYLGKLISLLEYNDKNMVWENFTETVDYIIKITIKLYGSLNEKNVLGCTYLHNICNDYRWLRFEQQPIIFSKYEYVIRQLILNGADINILDNYERTPLDKVQITHNVYRNEYHKTLHCKLLGIVDELVITKDKADQYIDDISLFILPDIANIVFDYSYCYIYKKC